MIQGGEIPMTKEEAYKAHIQHTVNAICKITIYHSITFGWLTYQQANKLNAA